MNYSYRRFFLSALLLPATLAMPTPSFAVQGYALTTIVSVLLESTPLPSPATGLLYGGCMAYLAVPVGSATNSPNCPGNWVAFSCDGTYTSKDTAQMMLDQAQLAWATKRMVLVYVDDTRLHNGYCFANRIDVRE